MAILRAVDGSFFEVPDAKLDEYKLSEEDVKARLDDLESSEPLPASPDMGPPSQPGLSPPCMVNIQIFGVSPIPESSGAPPADIAPEAAEKLWRNNWNLWRNNWSNWKNNGGWRNHWRLSQ